MIDGLYMTKLKRISHPKGDIFHALKSSDKGFSSFGEAYFSCVNFNEIKGWKKHNEMVLNLIVPIGSIRFVIFDDRLQSKTNRQFTDVTLNQSNYSRLTIPPGVWVAFQGKTDSVNLLLNVASIEHDQNESENLSLENIPYNWK